MKNNWQTKKLGEICDILDNLRVPVTARDRKHGQFPYYGATGIQDYVDGYIFDEDLILVGEDGARWNSGDNTAFKISGKTWVNNHAHVIRPHRNILIDQWLIHFLNISDLSDYITGTTVKKLNQEKLRSISVPLPSLNVQKEIVAKLDEKLTKLCEVKKLREEALADTEKILSQTLREIFKEGKQKDWEEKALHDICEIARGGSPRPIQHFLTDSDDGINWIKISDATSSEKYIYKTRQKITKDGLHKTRMVYPGDFILTNSMSFGRPYIMKTEGAIHDGWLLLRPNKNISEEYLYYFLSSDDIYGQFKKLAGGAVVQNLNSALVRNIKVLIPSITEQQKIVTKLDKLSGKIKTLQELQISQLADLKRLEKAYLRDAFSGKFE